MMIQIPQKTFVGCTTTTKQIVFHNTKEGLLTNNKIHSFDTQLHTHTHQRQHNNLFDDIKKKHDL